MVVIIWAVPAIPVNPLVALLIVIFGFFFATVSSRMVGMIGSSNNPVSGMAIATLLISTIVIKSSGQTGIDGMKVAIAIGSVICIIAAIAGDTSSDLPEEPELLLHHIPMLHPEDTEHHRLQDRKQQHRSAHRSAVF